MKVENSKYNKISRISVLVIFIAVLVPSLFSLTKRFISSAQEKASVNLHFEKIEIEYENIYSKELEAQISEFAQNHITQSTLLTFDQNEFYKDLKKKFKIIKGFECRIDSLTAHLKIVGIKPYCIINNSLVMGDKKKLFQTSLFDQFNLTDLKNIVINEKSFKNPLSKDIYSFIKQIPTDYWENFEINFIKSTEIYLTPKNSAINYCFLTNQKTILDKKKLTKAQELNKKLMKKKKNHKFVLDLRFKNRIISRFIASNQVKTELGINGREGG